MTQEERMDLRAFERVFRYVMDRIVERRLLPGDRITEPPLAEELGLSRTPIRQALARLVSEGFLENRPDQRGYRLPPLDRQDMQEVFSAREVLERAAAGFAAAAARGEDVELLRRIHREELEAAREGRIQDYAAANDRFHLELVRIGGNRYLCRAFPPVYWRSQLYVHALVDFLPVEEAPSDRGTQSPREHRHILEAVAARDEERAATAAGEHLRATWGYRIALGGRQDLLEGFLPSRGRGSSGRGTRD